MQEKNTVIIYDTIDWHTKKIVEFIWNIFEKNNLWFDVLKAEKSINLWKYEKIILISPIRYWYYLPKITKFAKDNFEELNSKKRAFVWINLVARKIEKKTPETNVYTKKFLLKTPFKPKIVWVFAWKLDYSLYNFFDRVMIKMIMKITKWPTSTPEPIEFTNWEDVEKFSVDFMKL